MLKNSRFLFENAEKELKGITLEFKVYIFIVLLSVLIIFFGFSFLNKIDTVIERQEAILKTQADCMDQIMWLRMEIDELKEPALESDSYPLTEDERVLVEKIVAAEARGESFEGMKAVAQVIRDRAEQWGKSIEEVCLATGQFATPYEGEIGPKVKEAVFAVFDCGCRVYEEPVTHFHADYVSPGWADKKVYRGRIGGHLFYN